MEEGVARPRPERRPLFRGNLVIRKFAKYSVGFLKEVEAMSFTKQCKLLYELWCDEFCPPGSLSEAIPNFSPTRDAKSDASFSTVGTLHVSNSAFRLGNLYQVRH
jgi:hypothetical protein